jgi:hypothetical protein
MRIEEEDMGGRGVIGVIRLGMRVLDNLPSTSPPTTTATTSMTGYPYHIQHMFRLCTAMGSIYGLGLGRIYDPTKYCSSELAGHIYPTLLPSYQSCSLLALELALGEHTLNPVNVHRVVSSSLPYTHSFCWWFILYLYTLLDIVIGMYRTGSNNRR